MLPNVVNFFRHNKNKKITILVYLYSAFYRLCIIILPDNKLEILMGIKGEESSDKVEENQLIEARIISYYVNYVTNHTLWESKCLVKALTARKLLMKKGIVTTLYLGVGKDEGEMVAHAWLRCGQFYVTGGNGENYAMVAKFKSM